MATEIKYRNVFGSEITSQQMLLLDGEYEQVQYVDGELKTVDFFNSGKIDGGEYYLSNGEDVNTIITAKQNVWRYVFFYLDTLIVNSYTVRNWEKYVGLTKVAKGKSVYDNAGREIATQTVNISSLEILKTVKTHYLETFGQFIDNGDVINFGELYFAYNYGGGIPPGTIYLEVNLPGYEHKSYWINDENNILLNPRIAEIFNWDNQTYYHAATPLIPE